MRGEHIVGAVQHVADPGSSPHARGTQFHPIQLACSQGIIPACAGNTQSANRPRMRPRDHPRMRGEHFTTLPPLWKRQGSSPHARGTQNMVKQFWHIDGIIPACAGNTADLIDNRAIDEDHPRMRGEHYSYKIFYDRISGSSPHARGTPSLSPHTVSTFGIIPACAGNTHKTIHRILHIRDHPRMRGEHVSVFGDGVYGEGSSPHARGTPNDFGQVAPESGIIPACAGNTDNHGTKHGSHRDHPRMRGEHCPRIVCCGCYQGSSPHARGTPGESFACQCALGIIPACAGNTSLSFLIPLARRDHPRMRGEHTGLNTVGLWYTGSSPHARGTPGERDDAWRIPGIIPACAGNTRLFPLYVLLYWDHPRMRGEHNASWPGANDSPGSSPHARGTPTHTVSKVFCPGIIPACAGNTRCGL